jgi:hypothetical protein
MNIVIARDDQTFGPYSRDQVADLLEQGELSPGDLASWEGGEDWQSLNELLSLPSASEQMDVREEDENEDDFDHEKMKQWEDVFVDDEDGFEDDEQFVAEPETQEVESALPSAQSSPPPSPEISEEQVVTPPATAPIGTTPSAGNSVPEEFPPAPPPPSSPAHAPPPPPRERNHKARDNENSSRPSPITPRSKKIKGLNSRQTVIVVKSAGILSKLYTLSLVFLILAVLSYLVLFVLGIGCSDEMREALPTATHKYLRLEETSVDVPAPPAEPSSPAPSSPPDSGSGTNNTGTK